MEILNSEEHFVIEARVWTTAAVCSQPFKNEELLKLWTKNMMLLHICNKEKSNYIH